MIEYKRVEGPWIKYKDKKGNEVSSLYAQMYLSVSVVLSHKAASVPASQETTS